MDKFAILSLEQTKQSFKVHKSRIVIGSVISADVRLVGEGIAPIHAVIEIAKASGFKEEVATIYDLASSSGIEVNGKKVVTSTLRQSDIIRIGGFELKFFVDDLQKAAQKMPLRVRDAGGQKLFINPDEDLSPLLLENEHDVYPIFNFQGTSERSLEVVMAWRGVILDIEHFKGKKVTIGNTDQNDFPIPPLLGEGSHALVTWSASGCTLHFNSQMHGVLQSKGELRTLEEVRAGAPKTETSQVNLNEEDFAKITLGEIDFYLSFSASPPRLKRRRFFERDRFFLKLMMGSMALSAAIIWALLNAKIPEEISIEELPPRIATIVYQPEKYTSLIKPGPKKTKLDPGEIVTKKEFKPKPEKKVTKLDIKPSNKPKPKKVPKELTGNKEKKKVAARPKKTSGGQQQGSEGEGKRAKGVEGKRGSKKAAASNNSQNQAQRKSPTGNTGRGGGRSNKVNTGNVDYLKGASAKVLDLLGGSAQKLGKGGKRLKGFGGFSTEGEGGLALSGSGSGGGGTAQSLGGLGDKGQGGGRVGTGLGAAGQGRNIIGGKTRIALRKAGPDERVVLGAIDADAVEAALLAHRDEFRLCYEREINAGNPDLAGRVGTSFTIGPAGRVTRAGVSSSSLKSQRAERCILKVIRRIQFPTPRGGGIVEVNYPFKFRSS